jgi:ubiquinone/menaquinone biosynthesis C-methylase UbiE
VLDETLEREREFHDRLATELNPERMPFVQPDALDRALIERLGDLRGRSVLELGAGSGDLTLEYARAGARLTALDLSPGMVDVARRRVERFVPDADVRFLVSPAETVDAPDGAFELIVGKWILHHTDLEVLTPEIRRLLAPGGRAVFIENSGLNPILRVAREHVTGRFGVRQVGTPDEHPLVEADFAIFESSFGRVTRAFPRFEFLRLLDRQVFRFRSPAVSRVCNAVDDFVDRRVPRLQPYSFRVLVELER